ncbi:MAG TPA: hypothetical protein VMM18_08925 [Gemmatimonadaceae bacterium]|nr:hypothetical protein [Gemmatimonadaceae bacterium]
MRRHVLSLAVLAAALAPAAAGAQFTRLDGRVDEGTRSAIVAIADSATLAGLPAELADKLVSRALLGASRGAAPGAIIDAVRSLAQRMGSAQQALGPARPVEIDAAAEALRVGVQPLTLSQLRSAQPRGAVDVALVVLVDLVQRGVPVDTASRLILALAETRVGDGVYHALREHVARDIGAGALPVVAAATRTRGVLATGAATTADQAERVAAPGDITGVSTRPRGGPPPPP